MLKFIDESDFLKVDTFKENEDGSFAWRWQDGDTTHTGVIFDGFTRTDENSNTVDVWQTLLDKYNAGLIFIQFRTPEQINEQAQLEQIQSFKTTRQQLIDSAVVTTSSSNQYDADEKSQARMNNAIAAANRKGLTSVNWSLANTATGVMTEVTLTDLEEAHELAVQNMADIWGIS